LLFGIYSELPEIKRKQQHSLKVLNKGVILGGFCSSTFLRHIAVTIVTTVLRVATRVCEGEMWKGGVRMRDRNKRGCE